MHLEVLVEEPSAEAALAELLPQIVPQCSFRLHPHGGKQALFRRLPERLRGYRHLVGHNTRIVVLFDEDREDCRQQKREVLRFARAARLPAASLLARVAIEELEAWFLGDPEAVTTAFPRVPFNYLERRSFRDPDAVRGGTWEALERLLQQAGYYRSGLPKLEVARLIASRMKVEENRSRSFRAFRDGLRSFAEA